MGDNRGMSGDGKSTFVDRPGSDPPRETSRDQHPTSAERPASRRDEVPGSQPDDDDVGRDARPTVIERPVSDHPDARDAKPTAVERPPSGAPALGTRQPSDRPSQPARRGSRRSIPPEQRYESGDEIGRGGMGRVVEATDTLLDRRVAVKEALTTDPELLRRFARETKITARLEHPSIVPVYDAGTADGAPFYVMRRVTGRPLSELIRNAPTLNERLALVPHVLAAAQAIAHAHQRGIIHRDIKPSNILVGELGETVVIDWGLAKVIGEVDDDATDDKEPDASGSLRTRLGSVFGTPGFMAPDQLRGDPGGPQGDVYSLGASLYNLLAAKPPHYSSDSTQMMKLASQGPPTPIGELVPGVPAELSTIVDKATDYDITQRYKDAGAFAEELKRFLAGQLVASHRYSRTERFVRLVRKHRAAVAIGGAATVIVLVVGAFAVSQVVEERDRADAQARLATQGRHEAEAARAMADERADQLLISRARALVETNPTAALASLKQLSPKSKHVDEARAIVSAARLRGVSWAMKAADTYPGFTTLDPSALRLAQITVKGKLHVYDLDARRHVFEAELDRGTQVRWILDGKFLVTGGRGATRVFASSGAEQPTDLPELSQMETDERGVTMIAIDTARRALLVDLEKHTTKVLAERTTNVTIDAAATYWVVVTDDDFLVFDRTNTVILRRPHKGTILRGMIAKTKVAVIDGPHIFEAPLRAGATWSELGLANPNKNLRPYWADYTNDRLFATYTDSRVVVENEGKLREIGRMEVNSGGMTPFARDYLVIGGDGRRIYYVDGQRMRQLYLPIALQFVRLTSRAAHPRIVAIGDGAIVVIDLETLPQLLPIDLYKSTFFVSEHMLVSSSAYSYNYAWLDLANNNRSTTVETEGAAELRSFDRATGRVMVVERRERGVRAAVFQLGASTPSETIDAPFQTIQLVGSDGIIYGLDNKVFGGFASSRRPELFSTNGNVSILVRLGETRYAVVAEHELVRGDLRSGAIERLALPDGLPVTYAIGHRGELVIARGDRILRWGATLTEIAKLEAPVDSMYSIDRGITVTLENHSSMFVEPDGTQTRLASTRGSIMVNRDRVIVPGQFQYDVVELPSFARWSLPIMRVANMADTQLDLSPSGTQMLEKTHDGRTWLWHLPVTDDFQAALNATNLTEDQNGLLLWPWQSAPKK